MTILYDLKRENNYQNDSYRNFSNVDINDVIVSLKNNVDKINKIMGNGRYMGNKLRFFPINTGSVMPRRDSILMHNFNLLQIKIHYEIQMVSQYYEHSPKKISRLREAYILLKVAKHTLLMSQKIHRYQYD